MINFYVFELVIVSDVMEPSKKGSFFVNVIRTGLGPVAFSLASPSLRVSLTSVSVKLLFISVHISKICSLSCCCVVVFSCDVDSGKLKMITLLSLFSLSFDSMFCSFT